MPFPGNDDAGKFNLIKSGKWTFSSAIWEDISDEAKDLIKKLLVLDLSKRLTGDEVLEHPWFKLAE